MYRTLDAALWTDPKVRRLTPESRLVFVYLITSPHSHVSGIYYLPSVLIPVETGLNQVQVQAALKELTAPPPTDRRGHRRNHRQTAGTEQNRGESYGLVLWDQEAETVWIRNALRYQGRGEKVLRAVANHVKSLRSAVLVPKFVAYYPQVKKFLDPAFLDTLSDTLSIGVPDLALRSGSGSGTAAAVANRAWDAFIHDVARFAPYFQKGSLGSRREAERTFRKIVAESNAKRDFPPEKITARLIGRIAAEAHRKPDTTSDPFPVLSRLIRDIARSDRFWKD